MNKRFLFGLAAIFGIIMIAGLNNNAYALEDNLIPDDVLLEIVRIGTFGPYEHIETVSEGAELLLLNIESWGTSGVTCDSTLYIMNHYEKTVYELEYYGLDNMTTIIIIDRINEFRFDANAVKNGSSPVYDGYCTMPRDAEFRMQNATMNDSGVVTPRKTTMQNITMKDMMDETMVNNLESDMVDETDIIIKIRGNVWYASAIYDHDDDFEYINGNDFYTPFLFVFDIDEKITVASSYYPELIIGSQTFNISDDEYYKLIQQLDQCTGVWFYHEFSSNDKGILGEVLYASAEDGYGFVSGFFVPDLNLPDYLDKIYVELIHEIVSSLNSSISCS